MVTVTRSWTDAITNAALLAGFQTAKYLTWLDERTVHINNIVPQFMHECTHHWCFDSLVGNAIALLTMRARRNSLLNGWEKRLDEISSDLLRAQAVEIMLQPYSEGLALFAEFDLTPGKSAISSQVMTSCVMCLGFPGKTLEDIETPAVALLQNTRRRPEFLRRKAGIYAGPFECEEGYLSGYLSVKSLWATLAGSVPAFADTELFLSYMRSYIYDDPNLVLVMLAEKSDEIRACEGIVNYIYRRFAGLIECNDLAVKVNAWEKACAHGRSVYQTIGADNRQMQLAQAQLIGLCSDIYDEGPRGKFAAHAFMTLQERKYLTLGGVAVRAKVDGRETRIESDEAPLIRYKLATSLPAGEHEGALIVVVPSNSRYVAVVFSTGHQSYFVRTFGDIDQTESQQISRYAINQPISASVHRQLEDASEQAKNDPMVAFFLDHNKSNCMRVATDMYGTLATLQAADTAVSDVLLRMSDRGLLGLLDDDIELVRGVAVVGLANTVGHDIQTIKVFARFMGLDEEIIDRTIEEASQRHEMQLLLLKHGNLIALV